MSSNITFLNTLVFLMTTFLVFFLKLYHFQVGSIKFLALLCILILIQLIKIFVDFKAVTNLDGPGSSAAQSSSNSVFAQETDFERILAGAAKDASGKYHVNRFYKAEGFSLDLESRDITLVTHTTVDRLAELVNLATIWSGPMSVSIC